MNASCAAFAFAFASSACVSASPASIARTPVDPRTPLARLRVEVANVGDASGVVVAALYDRGELFPKAGGAFATARTESSGGATLVDFDRIPEGRYAVVLYLDENRNGALDTSFVGAPTEPYGFSNDAPLALFGPPSFEACAIDVTAPMTRARVTLR